MPSYCLTNKPVGPFYNIQTCLPSIQLTRYSSYYLTLIPVGWYWSYSNWRVRGYILSSRPGKMNNRNPVQCSHSWRAVSTDHSQLGTVKSQDINDTRQPISLKCWFPIGVHCSCGRLYNAGKKPWQRNIKESSPMYIDTQENMQDTRSRWWGKVTSLMSVHFVPLPTNPSGHPPHWKFGSSPTRLIQRTSVWHGEGFCRHGPDQGKPVEEEEEEEAVGFSDYTVTASCSCCRAYWKCSHLHATNSLCGLERQYTRQRNGILVFAAAWLASPGYQLGKSPFTMRTLCSSRICVGVQTVLYLC